jgi:hypothetical protein
LGTSYIGGTATQSSVRILLSAAMRLPSGFDRRLLPSGPAAFRPAEKVHQHESWELCRSSDACRKIAPGRRTQGLRRHLRRARWAISRAQERAAFEQFIDFAAAWSRAQIIDSG